MRRKLFSGIVSGTLAITVTLALGGSAWAQRTFKTLQAFTRTQGVYAHWKPTLDAAGNLYGAACYGGAYGYGVVFKLAPNPDGSWTESSLHDFTGGADGSCPNGTAIFDAAGNLYSTAYQGGTYGAGVVFELTPNLDGSWTESVLYTFTGQADGQGPNPIIFGAQGALYGTVIYGGAHGWGVVFKLTPNTDGTWTESVLYAFTGGLDGGHSVGGLIFDAAGSLYGTTYWAGSAGCGTVFKLTPNSDGSWAETVLHEFTGGWDGANPADALTFDAAGNLYGATDWGTFSQSCGTTCGTVFQLTPKSDGGWTTRILHRFTGGKDGAEANGGCGVTFDAAGNLYGTRTGGGNNGYGVVFNLAPESSGGWGYHILHAFKGAPGAYPDGGVIFDAAGNLYGTTSGDGIKTFSSVFEITP